MGKSSGSSKSAQRAAADAARSQAAAANQLTQIGREELDLSRGLVGETSPLRGGLMQNLEFMLGYERPDAPAETTSSFTNPKTGQSFTFPAAQGTNYTPRWTENLPESERGILWDRVADAAERPSITLPPPIDARGWEAIDPLDVPEWEAVDPIERVTRANITSNPLYAARKQQLESAYGRARGRLMEDVPGSRYSGLLASELGDLGRNLTAAESELFGELGFQEEARRSGIRAEEVRGREVERGDILDARRTERLERVIGTEAERQEENLRAERTRQEQIAQLQQLRGERVRRDELAVATERARREGLLNLAAQLGLGQLTIGTGGLQAGAGTVGAGANALAQAGQLQSQQAQMLTQAQSDAKSGAGQLIGTLGSAAIKKCHTARLVFGETNINWLRFFDWKESSAPVWFRKFYNRYTERFARWLRDKPLLQRVVRALMLRVMREK